MFQRVVLGLAEQSAVREAMTHHDWVQPLVRRFVAGDRREDLLQAAQELAARGLTITADYLGESVRDLAQVRMAASEYLAIVDDLAARGLEPNASLKPSQIGLDVDPDLCQEMVEMVVERAARQGGFIRLDMESSAYTQRTLDLFARLYAPGRPVGVVIQAALRRSAADIEWLLSLGARVRLVKGAYREPPSVAFVTKGEVDRSYADLLDRLLADGHYPAVATHDAQLIRLALDLAARHGRGPHDFEFQMLFGVRRDLQLQLRQRGYRVRVYVPYGTAWYPYLTRRLAERPENLLFLVRSVLAEATAKRGYLSP